MNQKKILFLVIIPIGFALAGGVLWLGVSSHKMTSSPARTPASVSDFSKDTTAHSMDDQTQGRLPSSVGAPEQNSLPPQTAGSKAPKVAQDMAKEMTLPKDQGPTESCNTITYKHKSAESKEDDESWTHRKNLLTLPTSDINTKSVCVRVNGTPVRYQFFQNKNNQLILGPVASPKASITVRYCNSKINCPEDCTIPKDEFMSAIGGNDDDDDLEMQNTQANWEDDKGRKPSQNESELDGEVNSLRPVFAQVGKKVKKQDLTTEWIAGQGQLKACKKSGSVNNDTKLPRNVERPSHSES